MIKSVERISPPVTTAGPQTHATPAWTEIVWTLRSRLALLAKKGEANIANIKVLRSGLTLLAEQEEKNVKVLRQELVQT